MEIKIICECGNTRTIDLKELDEVIDNDKKKITVVSDYDTRLFIKCKCGRYETI